MNEKCPHFDLEIKETVTREKEGRYGGKVHADRRAGLPLIILEAYGYLNHDHKPLTDEEIFISGFQHYSVDLIPNEAEELGKILIQLASDCRKYPDRRTE